MTDNLITHLQIFGIGFSFAAAGPCLLVCTPILITYIVGRQDRWQKALADIAIFLFGRLFAYVALGAIAGLSGFYLRRFIQADLVRYFNLASGLISILLGIFVFFQKKAPACASKISHNKIHDFGSILVLGLMIGISPCAPLTALLFEIALISNSTIEGASYAFSFGLGTFLAGFVVIAGLAGLLRGFARKMIHSETANNIFRISCAILLVLLGLGLMRGGL